MTLRHGPRSGDLVRARRATGFLQDLANADCIVIQGSNMAEAHPVGFQWVMEAKARGAKVVHVDPRFTRTSALADTFVPLRVGTDIAFLGGIINYVLENELDFREYVVAYTNAAVIVGEDYQDTEDLDGLFSGFDPETAHLRPGELAVRRVRCVGRRRGGAGPRHAARDSERAAARVPRLGRAERPRARRDPPAPELRLPDPQAALLPLHPRGGVTHLRRLDRGLPRGGSGLRRELRPRPHHGARLQRRLDPAQRGRAVHPHRRDPAAAAREHGSTRRRHHGAARARQHPGIDRHPDAVQPAPRLPPDAHGRTGRQPRRLDRGDQPTRVQGLLGHRTLLRGEPAQGLLGRRRNRRERLLLRLPAQDHR